MNDQRLRNSIRRLLRRGVQLNAPIFPALTPEWAENMNARMATVERQLKLLNATLITGIMADIAIRLIPK